MEYKIARIPGDGIGPEISEEAVRILSRIGELYGHTFAFTEVDAGGVAIDKYGDPLPEEQEACIGWLRRQTALIKPNIIVCLGRVAACRLISPEFKVTREHGQFIEKNGVWMMGTLHPAAVLRVPAKKPEWFEDFLALREKIGEVCARTELVYPE